MRIRKVVAGAAEFTPRAIEDVERCILRLDGDRWDFVALCLGDDPEKDAPSVAGGDGGRCLVRFTGAEGKGAVLCDPSMEKKDAILMTIGGQSGDYEASSTVDLRTAVAAARRFSLEGVIDPSLKWKVRDRR